MILPRTAEALTVPVLVIAEQGEAGGLDAGALGDAGYTVTQAASAAEWPALSGGRFGVLIIGLDLIDGKGLKLIEAARDTEPDAVPIIATVHDSTSNLIDSLRAGASEFLTLPCPAERLLKIVGRAAGSFLQRKRLTEYALGLESVNRELSRRVEDATAEIFALNEDLRRTVAELTARRVWQEEFLQELSHDLKNQLATISGYGTMLSRKLAKDGGSSDIGEGLAAITRSAKRLEDSVDALLEVGSRQGAPADDGRPETYGRGALRASESGSPE